MSVESQIREAIRAIAGVADGKTAFFLAEVSAVDESGETCSVRAFEAEWSDVRLTAVSGGSDLKVFPSVGSLVMVADLSGGRMGDLAVVMFSTFDRIEMHEAKHTVANADVLRKELQKLTGRVDGIIKAIKDSVAVTDYSGAGLQRSMSSLLDLITEKEDFSDIEDETIKH